MYRVTRLEHLRSAARDRGDSRDGLGDGARAVRDGQGRSLSDGVGHAVVSQEGGLRAVGGQGRDDLGGVGHVRGGGGSGGQSQDGGSGELHLDG